MKEIKNQVYDEERALYNIDNMTIDSCHFKGGESPLKECHDIVVNNSKFSYRYPIWYGKNLLINNTIFDGDSRAGGWYNTNFTVNNCSFNSPKWFRKLKNVAISNVESSESNEYFWYCDNLNIENSKFNGFYFCKDSKNIVCENLELNGKYAFQNCKNVHIKDSVLHTKDAFWDCENVIVENSTITGEYLGWNSKKLTFINCHLESLQGLCYIEGLKLVNCTMKDTSLAFELCSKIDATIRSHVDSIKNPISGKIIVESCDEVIFDGMVDPSKCKVYVGPRDE